MSLTLAAILGWIGTVLIGAIAYLLQRGRGQSLARSAEQAADRQRQAEQVMKAHEDTQAAIEATQERHREEQKQVCDSLDAGRRDQLGGDW